VTALRVGGGSGRVLPEEKPAVVAAEEEGEAVQVGAESVQAVGGVADVGQERWGERGRVGGEPAGDELEGLGELERLAASLLAYIGHPAYGPDALRSDLERFTFLLGGSDGEHLFGPGE
jgi:hypothetical protein